MGPKFEVLSFTGEEPQRKRMVEALAQGKITFSSMFCTKSPLNQSNNLENNSKGIYGSNLGVKNAADISAKIFLLIVGED